MARLFTFVLEQVVVKGWLVGRASSGKAPAFNASLIFNRIFGVLT